MNENETFDVSAMGVEDAAEDLEAVKGYDGEDLVPEEGLRERIPEEMTETTPEGKVLAGEASAGEAIAGSSARENPSWEDEAEALRAVYPGFDLATEMRHPVMGAMLRGEIKPTLRQLYEAVHWESMAAERVEAAVAAAVRESEERLLGHIRARGQRPSENGINAAAGVRMHPAVNRMTRRERAQLARRAECGEHIRF